MKNIHNLLIFTIFLSVTSCNTNTDFYHLPLYSGNNFIQAVIEIPAGTNHKIEYHSETNEFLVDSINGHIRIIDFLPYPANYGFIPSTYMDKARGGDGDALDVVIINESLPTTSVIEIIPIAMISLNDRGEIDNKILAVPADIDKRVITATTYLQLKEKYPQIIHLLETWFLNYKGKGNIEILGWYDDKYALNEIEKWSLE